ncbi:hypothetical protein [Parasitella parasitica]|uniref:Hyaluronan/mRNA-binding protein domain-containing protein n=1 Tax=Parasitella parasitica TaxID=35722 RepID=A0A0B7NP53_9FUNG|nr:hypothetical protein [Parasitella parasitica]
MSTYSKNLFDILGDGEVPRPAPVKEEAPVVDKKAATKEVFAIFRISNEEEAVQHSSHDSTILLLHWDFEKTLQQSPRDYENFYKKSDLTPLSILAARGAKGGKPKGARQQNGRPQRGRQFDRHSGTGIVDSEKKINQGWGKAGSAEAEGAKDPLNPADPDAPEAEVATPVEEEEQVKTLDEYLAEKANKSLKVSLPEARKANDADDSAFKGTVAFAKEEFEEFYVSKETKTVKKTTEKTRKEKVVVDIEQRFQEKARPEFRKNDRRAAGRGGKNNNNRRSTKNAAAPAVNLQDASAFPTLGATA